MTIGKEDGVVSLDTFSIEVFREDGIEYVEVCRTDKDDNKYPGLLFRKDNSEVAGVAFLAQVAELIGVDLVVKKGKK